MADTPSCKTCIHGITNDTVPIPHGSVVYLRCIRFPPVATESGGWSWPLVVDNQYCGEFKKREELS